MINLCASQEDEWGTQTYPRPEFRKNYFFKSLHSKIRFLDLINLSTVPVKYRLERKRIVFFLARSRFPVTLKYPLENIATSTACTALMLMYFIWTIQCFFSKVKINLVDSVQSIFAYMIFMFLFLYIFIIFYLPDELYYRNISKSYDRAFRWGLHKPLSELKMLILKCWFRILL